MAKVETWLIEPRDALIVRDGRPFGNIPGTRATSLDFPFPSTTTGGARTRAGLGSIGGDLEKFDKALADKVLQISVRGALLAELNAQGHISSFLAPAPADCVLLKPENGDDTTAQRIPLVPLAQPAQPTQSAEAMDTADTTDTAHAVAAVSNLDTDLHLVGAATLGKGKPHDKAPRFWRWAEYEKWLAAPHTALLTKPELSNLGHNGVTGEQRTHVRIDYAQKANVTGGLFQTRGLEFTHTEQQANSSHQTRQRLALALEVEPTPEMSGQIKSGLAPLGGERRVVAWRSGRAFPVCPPKVKAAIIATQHCRLILLTPAHFVNGFQPTWLKTAHDVTAKVEAIAVNRPQVVSGWDFVVQKPKPTRRLAPSGTVLFLSLTGTAKQIAGWVDNIWLRCVSDDDLDARDKEQSRRDGFGLAALGVWDGKFKAISEVLGA